MLRDMNYNLSCVVLKDEDKMGFTLERGGRVLESRAYRKVSSSSKENSLNVVLKGISVARGYLTHMDSLVIEVESRYLERCLNGYTEYKEYLELLDNINTLLDSCDCRYSSVYNKSQRAGYCVRNLTVGKVEGTRATDIMRGLE